MILRGTLQSTVLEMETGVTIITPTEYSKGLRPQVAYVLHGLGAGSGSWAEYSMLPAYAKDYDVMFIMPEVGRSYFFDMRYGQRFFSYIADELPELCEQVFNISAKREDTAVIGGSMGGYGALKCAFSRPERFGKCCAFSCGGLHLRERVAEIGAEGGWERLAAEFGPQRARDYRAMLGDDLELKPEDEIAVLARQVAAGGPRPELYLACGTEDQFYGSNTAFRDVLRGLGYDFTWEEWPGEHEWPFFDAALRKSLRFCFGEGMGRKLL